MDVEKTVRFILKMQAKHEAAVHKHDEQIAKHDEAITRVERLAESNATRISELVDVSFSLARHGEEVDGCLVETNRLIEELAKAQAEAHARTEYKLNALIDTADKIIRRNGGAS